MPTRDLNQTRSPSTRLMPAYARQRNSQPFQRCGRKQVPEVCREFGSAGVRSDARLRSLGATISSHQRPRSYEPSRPPAVADSSPYEPVWLSERWASLQVFFHFIKLGNRSAVRNVSRSSMQHGEATDALSRDRRDAQYVLTKSRRLCFHESRADKLADV